MSWASDQVVGLLIFLLPGFVTAAIFYSLTSYPKPSAFERVIQALIFTAIAQALVVVFVFSLRSSGLLESAQLANTSELVLSVLVAVALGLLVSYVLNKDVVHRILRSINVTKQNSYPSEWYSVFSRKDGCYVVLHMIGERRLYGWPEEWPNRSDEGHFQIAEAEWLDAGQRIPTTGVSAILIPASEVEMVEFMDPGHRESEE